MRRHVYEAVVPTAPEALWTTIVDVGRWADWHADLASGTKIRITIEVCGALAFLRDRLVARKEAAGAAEQTRAFVRFAERAS